MKVLQEKTFFHVGGSKEIKMNARIITATNKNLERLVQEEKFREDLFYRLYVIPIEIPPLRKRLEDEDDEKIIRIDLSSLQGTLKEQLRECEKIIILNTLLKQNNDKKKTMKLLNIKKSSFYKKIVN